MHPNSQLWFAPLSFLPERSRHVLSQRIQACLSPSVDSMMFEPSPARLSSHTESLSRDDCFNSGSLCLSGSGPLLRLRRLAFKDHHWSRSKTRSLPLFTIIRPLYSVINLWSNPSQRFVGWDHLSRPPDFICYRPERNARDDGPKLRFFQ
jgi:hypothetical protein